MTIIEFPRETGPETHPIDVRLKGVLQTVGVSFSVVDEAARPAAWVPAVVADGYPCITITPSTTLGRRKVWAQVVITGQTIVLDCGLIRIT